MTCPACGEMPKNTAKDFTKAVIEINNPEEIILFRKVVIPISMGDDTDVPAAIGKYRNVLLVYEANNHAYLYSSDGIPTLLTSDEVKNLEEKINAVAGDLVTETNARIGADQLLQQDINTKVSASDLAPVALSGAYSDLTGTPTIDTTLSTTSNNAVANATVSNAINDAVLTGVSTGTPSTSTVTLSMANKNLYSGTTGSTTINLPVASTTQAGMMNSSTYEAITTNSNNINAILNGAVAITGLSASPSQSDLTAAWQAETGLGTLINRASIYDVTNNKVWTYYSNDTTWYAASNSSQVTINTFTNSSEGTILGSTNTGQIFAENDGTGSVNGWDNLVNTVSGKQDTLTAGTNISISSNTISATDTTYSAGTGLSLTGTTFAVDTTTVAMQTDIPTVNNATLTIQKNGTNVGTFTANASSNVTANIEVPVITMQTTDPGEGSVLAADHFIAVYSAS